MLRSLMTAVTGVRAHQTMLDVTGNNISNANTTGFKKDNTLFADLMYQASKYASSADGNRGGINPAQVGLGVSVAAIETIHTQGSSSYTGNASDMMIQDRGFFVYTDGTNQLFSRSGACTLDGNSDLVQSGSGYKLQGYKMEETALEGFQQAAELSTVNIPLGQKMEAKATTRVDYQCNLDSRQKNFLSYGFADLPFNAVAGANDLTGGQAKIIMDGTSYDLSMETDFNATANETEDGVNYLKFTLTNGGEELPITLDMIGIDSEGGKPVLRLPSLVDVTAAGEGTETTTTTQSSAILVPNNTTAQNVTDANRLVGYINVKTREVLASDGITGTIADSGDYAPVYQLPGKNPPEYVAAQYDADTGIVSLRKLNLTADTAADATFSDNTSGKVQSLAASSFSYNIKDKMDYSYFQLKGSPILGEGENATPTPVEYDFIVEFDESVDRGAGNISELGQTTSKLTLWYYGLSNDDGTEGTAGMHKLEANVSFKADGTFDVIDWQSTNNYAPLGYYIVPGIQSPNFIITAGSSSAASTKADTISFKQAQNLSTPGSTDDPGAWSTAGSMTQGGYHATKATIYDDNGKEHTLEVTYKKITENRWRWEAFIVEQDDNGNDVRSDIIPYPRTGEIEFDGSGQIKNAIVDSNDKTRRGEGQSITNAEVEITLPFSLNGQPNSTVTLNFGGSGNPLLGVTQFASETTTKPVYQDGYTMGILKNYSVAANGTITGSYSNGVSIPLYRVALATFANEQGLEKVGNTMFQASVNSGTANIDGAGSNGKGSIMGQYVEMSNVDLTEEFTHLIIAQRGFQANTRVVTVSDQILEEVVNLKR